MVVTGIEELKQQEIKSISNALKNKKNPGRNEVTYGNIKRDGEILRI